ncbi:MAG TPA: hypothetical protein PK919_04130 [Candidatus Aminicenantes bacterium]|nr:hypothetical protein [Candidatus Aminicenantes bacterium]
MKKIALLLALAAATLLPLPGSVSGGVDVVSRYVWRGFDLLYDNHPAVQPYLNAGLGDSRFSLGIWSSFALASWSEYKAANEIDLTLAYDFAMPEGWELAAGATLYGYWFAEDFRFGDATSPELFASLTRSDLPLSPCLSVYYDLNLGSGLYATLGGSHEWKLAEKARLEAGGLIGFNSRQYIEKTGFSDIDLYVRAPLSLGRATLVPSLNVMVPLMDEVNEATEFWVGISIVLGGDE